MNIVELNKYRPSIFKNGRYLKDDWISASQIGEIWNGARLDADVYLSVEDRYVRAIASVLDLAGLAKLTIRGLEYWETSTSEVLPRLPTAPAPREGSEVFAHEVGDLVRRFCGSRRGPNWSWTKSSCSIPATICASSWRRWRRVRR